MAVRQEVSIKVTENNDPLVLVGVTTITPDGEVPYDFTGVSDVKFWGKLGKVTDDGDSFAKYSQVGGEIAIVGDPEDGQLSIQMVAVDLATPGVFRYHLDAIRGSLVETVMAGYFILQDV